MAFQECYLNDNGELTWVYDYKELKNHGIIPDELITGMTCRFGARSARATPM